MAATSVTGTGLGGAGTTHKGTKRDRISASSIVGPRVVYSGTGSTDGSGDLTVVLPGELPGSASDYSVIVTAGTAAAAGGTLAIAGGVGTLTISGPNSAAVSILVVKAGFSA